MLRWRTAADGSIWIPRSDPETESYLDSLHMRWPGQLRWSPKPPDSSYLGDIEELADRFNGQSAILFGKGPSLEHFIEHDIHLSNVPMRVCLNETCLVVPHPHYTFFVDPHNAELIQFPENCSVVCPPSMVNRIKHLNGNRVLTFFRGQWILPAYATAACALVTLCKWGFKSILLVGFDAFDQTMDEQHTSVAYPKIVREIQTKARKDAYYGPINNQLRGVLLDIGGEGVMVDFYHRSLLAS